MRRRAREYGPESPPPELLRFTGTTTREKLAWLRARERWWDATHDEEHVHSLTWLLEAYDQIGDAFPWCGDRPGCTNPDCLCGLWPEHLALEEQHLEPVPNRERTHDR